MKRLLFTLALLPQLLLAGEKTSLFNGKDLEGWNGDPRLWSVVDGILVGETNKTDKKVGANSFLIWKGGELGDFDFEITARVKGNNSGVQYRSRVIDPAKWSVGGYQMDLHPKQEFLAMLYEERGRGIQCLRGQKVTLEAGKKKATVTGELPRPEVKLEEWNTYKLEARGNVVKHYVNGELAAVITDENEEKRSLKGVLALQLHAGAAMTLEVKAMSLTPVKK